jgi:hypothetical protein
MGGLCLGDLLRLRAQAAMAGKTPKDTSVILVWLEGGMSQLETFDMKPEAPAEYRGEFNRFPRSYPGSTSANCCRCMH